MAISTGKVVALIQAMGSSADPAVIESAVQDWLDNHPEATTTVQDGSITEQKLASAVAAKLAEVTDLKSAISTYDNSIEEEYTATGKKIFKYTFVPGKTYILHQYSSVSARYSTCTSGGGTIANIKNTTPAAEYEMEFTITTNADYFYCTATGDVHFVIYEKGLIRQEVENLESRQDTIEPLFNKLNSDYWKTEEFSYTSDGTRQIFPFAFQSGEIYLINNMSDVPCEFTTGTASAGMSQIGTFTGKHIFDCTLSAPYIRCRVSSGVDVSFSVSKLGTEKAIVENIESMTTDDLFRSRAKLNKTFSADNDFTFVKDELWTTLVVDEINAKIFRWKYYAGEFYKVGEIACDFGHLNSIDYNYENDCLIFGNGGNDTETTGNWFAIVKNPYDLPSTASLADNAIVVPVDVGFKVQAVWGDSNRGKNNIVILVSNNATTINILLLERDTNGDFTGTFRVLETHTLSNSIGVGGMCYNNNTLFIGDGTKFAIHCISMIDYTDKIIEQKYYDDAGNEITGSTQGVHVDSKYLWWFTNTEGETGNRYLTQNYK